MKFSYPKSYKVKPLLDQLTTLKNVFGLKDIKTSLSEANNLGEAQFAIPHYKLIAPTYNEAVLKVMEKLKETRLCYDYRDGNWTEKYLRQLPIKEQFWNNQKEEIIVISAQFGQKYAGISVQNVRKELSENELPLGIYECLIMLITHPERLQNYDDLCIDCAGDEYSSGADGAFSEAPIFGFDDDRVRFDTHAVSLSHGYFGSASALLSAKSKVDSCSLETFEPLDLTFEKAVQIVKEKGYKITREKIIIEEL